MSTGYATDNSTERNKRVRMADSTKPSAASGGAKAKNAATAGPLQLAQSTANAFVASLHAQMRNNLLELAGTVLQLYSTWFHKNRALQKMKNNPSYIPSDAQIGVVLHPVERIAEDQGFKDLAKQTAGVVEQCRKLLREPILECTVLNERAMLLDVQEAFVKGLPDLAELVLTEAGVDDYGKHQAVSDLLEKHHGEILPTFRLQPAELRTMYCALHGLQSFPTPSSTPPASGGGTGTGGAAAAAPAPAAPAAAPAAPGGPPTTSTLATPTAGGRGGNGSGATPTTPQAGGTIPPAQQPPTNLAEQIQAVVDRSERVLTEAQQLRLNGLDAETQQCIFQLLTAPSPAVASTSETNAAINQHNNPSPASGGGGGRRTPVHNPYTRSGGVGGGTGNAVGGGGNAFDYTDHGRSFTTAAEILVQETGLGSKQLGVVEQLLLMVKGAFVGPIAAYNGQSTARDTALRIKSVATKQSLTKAADATTMALEQEARIDPKLVKVMVQQKVQKEVAKEMKKASAKSEPKKQQSKKAQRGAKNNGASQKKKSPKQRGRSPSNVASAHGGADAKNNDGGGGKRSTRGNSSTPRSRKKQGSGASRRGKSRGASNRK